MLRVQVTALLETLNLMAWHDWHDIPPRHWKDNERCRQGLAKKSFRVATKQGAGRSRYDKMWRDVMKPAQWANKLSELYFELRHFEIALECFNHFEPILMHCGLSKRLWCLARKWTQSRRGSFSGFPRAIKSESLRLHDTSSLCTVYFTCSDALLLFLIRFSFFSCTRCIYIYIYVHNE